MRRKNDILWKGITEEVFDDLLRFIFRDADNVFDMDRGFVFLDKELAELYPEPNTRFVDQLVRLYRRDGGEEWVLCHIEIQGLTKKEDRQTFPDRMFRYFYRAYDRHRKPVMAVAIFTGPDGKRMPLCFEYSFMQTRLKYEYHALRVMDLDDEELARSSNPFALVMLAAKTALLEGKMPAEALLERKVFLASELFKKGYSNEKVRAIFRFLECYIGFEDPELNRSFRERVQQLHNNNNVMGIIEYMKQEAREAEQENTVKILLTKGSYSQKEIADLMGYPLAFVRKVAKQLKAGTVGIR